MRSYLFNPYALLSCLARSTTTIDNAVLMAAIGAAGPLGGAMLAIASHLSLYPVLLVAPFAMRSRWSLLAFAASFLGMTALNTVIFGHSWMGASWGVM
jgi:phosphatidylinositol glycan class U